MRIILIRHGETPGNAQNRYIGSTDEPLSEQGRAAAYVAVPDITVKKVFVTPLQRTQQTAAILFPKAEQTVVRGLREFDFGTFENRNYADMEQDPDYRAWVESGCTSPCPGGEDMAGFVSRVGEAFMSVLRENADKDSLTFVVHGGTIMAVCSLFAEEKRNYYDWAVHNLEGWTAEAVLNADGSLHLVSPEKLRR